MPNSGALTSFSATYANDGYIRLQVNGNTGSPTTAPERLYFSRWNQGTNEFDGEYWVAAQHYDGNDPGSIAPTANRKYRWRVRGWRSDGGTGFGPYLYSDYVQTSPAAPSGVAAGLSGPNAISLSWFNNATLNFYDYNTDVFISTNGGAWAHWNRLGPGSTSAHFPDLTPGATYKFGVQAVSTYGAALTSALVETATITSIGLPAATSGMTATRNSDTQATVSWTNNGTAGAPYGNIAIERWDSSGQAWAVIANVGGTTTSVTDTGIVAGRKYQWRTIASNSVGYAGSHAYSGNVFTTPSAPSNVTAQYVGGTSVKIDWTNTSSYSEYGLRLQVYKNGAVEGSAITLASGVTSSTQTIVAGNNYYFRVWAVSDTGSLASAETQSNNIVPAAPPNAPTGLTSSGSAIDLVRPYSISWTHSPTDGSAQTKYQIQHRAQGGSTWTVGSVVTSTSNTVESAFASAYTNGTTIEWQVRTNGVHATAGPWSATATQATSTTPTVVVTGPSAVIVNSTVTVAWTYTDAQATPQSEWAVELYDTASASLVASQSGVGTASSVTLAYSAVDGGAYRAEVRVRDGSGLWSDKGTRTFSGLFTPPAIPVLAAALDEPSGAALLNLTPTATTTPGEVVTTNLILNPKFATATTGWNLVGTVARDATGINGGPAMKLTRTNNVNVVETTGAHRLAVTPGDVLSLSALVRLDSTVGDVVVHIMYVNSSSVLVGYSAEAQYATNNTTTTLKVQNSIVPAGAAFAVARFHVDGGGNGAAWVTNLMLTRTATAPAYFDGDTARDSTYYYEWTGTANASTSVQKRIGSLAASAVSIERRFWDYETEAFGEWETLISEAPVDALLVDPTAPTHDDGEYRVIAHTLAPSIGRPNFTVKPPPIDNRWLYVSGGAKFDVVCKMWANIEISQTASRERALHYFAGRKNPVIYSGEAAERTYAVSGILEDEATDPNQWIRLARQAGPVLLRAPGRRMFGNLSEVSIDRIQNGLHQVSFSIQEVATK